MIRGLILYYLSIKPTHGYEIQRFIQISGIDQWAKIQSGSIYYALTKLEKEKNIQVLKEERNGSRIRRIYEITDLGRKELEREMRVELETPIMEIGSLKYIVYPLINVLSKQETMQLIEKHISDLAEKKKYWESWRDIKAGETSDHLTRLSFDMTIHTLEDQIIWHQELLNCLDDYRKEAESMDKMIKAFEPDSIPEGNQQSGKKNELQEFLALIEKIQESADEDPKRALEQLNAIVEDMKGQNKG